jgi:CheY-like chemotaxis protein
VDVKAVVTQAAEQVHPLIEAGRHSLVVQLGAARACVLGDRARLIQVTANLLANAAKYTPAGGRIMLSVEPVDGKVRIEVTDNGSGIDADLLPHVFDLFVQGKRTPDRAQGGLGLGLALVKNIVGMHGGQVAARSAGAGRGSTFTVELPMLTKQAPVHPAQPPALAPAPETMRARRRIMLVDDNVDAAQTLAALLETAGHMVHTVNDPRAALAAAVTQLPDAFILDIGMPGIDGHALARQLRAQPQPRAAALGCGSGARRRSTRARERWRARRRAAGARRTTGKTTRRAARR